MLKTQQQACPAKVPAHTKFYDEVLTFLKAENCPIWHGENAEGAPQTRKIPKTTLAHKPKLKQSLKKRAKEEPRKLLRLQLTKWKNNLQKAHKEHNC